MIQEGFNHSIGHLRQIGRMVPGFLLAWCAVGCDSDAGLESFDVILDVRHMVDSSLLTTDQLIYVNEAGNPYSVTSLTYFLDSIVLTGEGNTPNHTIDATLLVDEEESKSFTITGVPVGTYSGLAFIVGLRQQYNLTGYLPATQENLLMAWPNPMGGGYHFMKLEGHFISDKGAGSQYGFALHQGNNGSQAFCHPALGYEVNADVHLRLDLNINEVFTHPSVFDLDEVNYTMGVTAEMQRVAINMEDAFTLHSVQ